MAAATSERDRFVGEIVRLRKGGARELTSILDFESSDIDRILEERTHDTTSITVENTETIVCRLRGRRSVDVVGRESSVDRRICDPEIGGSSVEADSDFLRRGSN